MSAELYKGKYTIIPLKRVLLDNPVVSLRAERYLLDLDARGETYNMRTWLSPQALSLSWFPLHAHLDMQ